MDRESYLVAAAREERRKHDPLLKWQPTHKQQHADLSARHAAAEQTLRDERARFESETHAAAQAAAKAAAEAVAKAAEELAAANADAELEVWAAHKQAGALEEALDRKVRIEKVPYRKGLKAVNTELAQTKRLAGVNSRNPQGKQLNRRRSER